jgi:hypothetical protein
MRHVLITIIIASLALVSAARADPVFEQTLAGQWLVFWTAEGRVSTVLINNVLPQGNVIAFDGLILQGNERCPLTGTLINSAHLDYTDGIERTSIEIPSVARLSASCSNMTMALELLGLSGSEFLLSGRAIITIGGGSKLIQPIGMSPKR